jgi:hypothetical protein
MKLIRGRFFRSLYIANIGTLDIDVLYSCYLVWTLIEIIFFFSGKRGPVGRSSCWSREEKHCYENLYVVH